CPAHPWAGLRLAFGGSNVPGSAAPELPALRLEALPVLRELRRERFAEVLGLEHRPDLDLRFLAHRIRATLDPVDGLLQGADLPDPVARHQLLRFRKGSVDDGAVLPGEAHTHALRAGPQPVAVPHDPCFHQFLVVGHHLRDQLCARHLAGFRALGRLHEHHDFHGISSVERLRTCCPIVVSRRAKSTCHGGFWPPRGERPRTRQGDRSSTTALGNRTASSAGGLTAGSDQESFSGPLATSGNGSPFSGWLAALYS